MTSITGKFDEIAKTAIARTKIKCLDTSDTNKSSKIKSVKSKTTKKNATFHPSTSSIVAFIVHRKIDERKYGVSKCLRNGIIDIGDRQPKHLESRLKPLPKKCCRAVQFLEKCQLTADKRISVMEYAQQPFANFIAAASAATSIKECKNKTWSAINKLKDDNTAMWGIGGLDDDWDSGIQISSLPRIFGDLERFLLQYNLDIR